MLNDRLRSGIDCADKTGALIRYRYLRAEDSIDGITTMLHAAYATLADQGMRFVASYQDSNVTRKRVGNGETIVAVDSGDQIVGIVTLKEIAATRGSPFYERDDVASFGQFAVHPSHQGRGIGAMLMILVEERAREKGVRELALDTSESATHLIAMYQAKGFRFIEHLQWGETNYRSMVFSKNLSRETQAATLHLICGLPCSGKTTFARTLERERSALRLSPDEWIARLFGSSLSVSALDAARDPVERALWDLAKDLLKLGVDVILEFGFWTRRDRDDFRARAALIGARTELHFTDASLDELLRRLRIRNTQLPPDTFWIDEERLKGWFQQFERPEPDELR